MHCNCDFNPFLRFCCFGICDLITIFNEDDVYTCQQTHVDTVYSVQ